MISLSGVIYVLAVAVVVAIVPWNNTELGNSPFIAALERIGIAGSADIMNAIVVTAVLSCLNSGIYTGSRMLFALARRGDAPKCLLEVNARGVPLRAILLFCYVLIALSELRMRRRLEREAPEKLVLKMWLYPWLTYFAVGGMVSVILAMALVDDVRPQLWWSLGSLAVVLGAA